MDEQQSRIVEDLRGVLDGEVRCDHVFLQLYASDASIYQVRPLAVVLPRSTADVQSAVRYAAENGLPVHARGAGTGLAGGSLGPGIVIDFSKHLRRIIHVSAESVRVEPGVVLERLNTQLRSQGRHFGPDPATAQVTTLGSVVAVDGAGSHWLKYGSAHRHVISAKVVLADGSLVEFGREALPPAPMEEAPRKPQIVEELSRLLSTERERIAQHQPRSGPNCSGYALAGALGPGVLDMSRILSGSEGTLALFTELTLATQPLPAVRGTALLLFHSLEAAARAVREVLPTGVVACDLMDRRHLSLAREAEPRYDLLIPEVTEALLLVEHEGESEAEVHDRLRETIAAVQHRSALAFESRLAWDADDTELHWQLARRVTPTLHRMKGSARPLPIVEDLAVPPEELPAFLFQLQNVLKRNLVVASLFGHAGHGQLHVRPFLDLSDPHDLAKIDRLAGELYDAVIGAGGTISGEHGDGLSRTAFVRRQYGELYPVFQEVKRIFDPHNVLNPGKVIGDDPRLHVRHLRSGSLLPKPTEESQREGDAPPPHKLVDLQLTWTPRAMDEMARSCNGCGACRSAAPDVRMCPIFRFAPCEEASPRAKANILRGVFSGTLDPANVATEDFKAVMDLCVNCQMCRLECPAAIDIPRLVTEAKAAYVEANGLRFRDWALANVDTLAALGSRVGRLANRMIASPRSRWLVERILGVHHGRKLPRFAGQSFLRRARRRRLTRTTRRSGPKVVYFVDTYANFFDPQLAESVVAVFEYHGIAVYVHPGQVGSGMALISAGAVTAARQVARQNVSLLADAVRQGYQIVASEPSAVLCLTREYLALSDDEDTRLVADNSHEVCDYLWGLHREGQLRLEFRPLNATVGYHVPCHLKALGCGTPGENLLRLIPGLQVTPLERGCSGMAGTFGLKQENFRASLRAGWGLISAVRDARLDAGVTECSTCKLQMEQGTSKPTLHPVKLLAGAYGLLPEISHLLKVRSGELTVT